MRRPSAGVFLTKKKLLIYSNNRNVCLLVEGGLTLSTETWYFVSHERDCITSKNPEFSGI